MWATDWDPLAGRWCHCQTSCKPPHRKPSHHAHRAGRHCRESEHVGRIAFVVWESVWAPLSPKTLHDHPNRPLAQCELASSARRRKLARRSCGPRSNGTMPGPRLTRYCPSFDEAVWHVNQSEVGHNVMCVSATSTMRCTSRWVMCGACVSCVAFRWLCLWVRGGLVDLSSVHSGS